MCVRARARACVCVCVCVSVSERERERVDGLGREITAWELEIILQIMPLGSAETAIPIIFSLSV